MELAKDVEAGQAVYSKLVLAIYDLWVLSVSNRFFWKCPTPLLLREFNRHVSANHLDVGVGTGYYVDRCRFPGGRPRLGLMDLNANSLEAAAARVARYGPERYRANVLEPLTADIAPFDSISLYYLLHCLPGALSGKAVVFDTLDTLLNPGGVVFGATILQGDAPRNGAARKLMAVYNAKGIFSNAADTLPQLEQALAARFDRHEIALYGCVAVFSARKASA